MTEEEMAEEYMQKNNIWFEDEFIKQAFLAGLKAGKPKWHKVADGDLPKNENDVLVYSGEGWNYSLDVKVKAEQFLKELEK